MESNPLWNAHHLYIDGHEITDLVIPNSVNEIYRYAFSGCSSLTSVEIPNSVTKIGPSAFEGCSSLTSAEIPNSVNEIGDEVFARCSGLQSVYIGSGIKEFGKDIWIGCPQIRKVVYIGNTAVGAEGYSFESEVYNYATLFVLEEYIIKAKETMPWKNFKSIKKYVSEELKAGDDFVYNGITYTVIDPKAKTVKTKDGEGQPYGSINPGNIASGNLVLPENVYHGLESYTLTEIGNYGFIGSDFTSVQIPNSVTAIGKYAFWGCSNLTSAQIGNSVT